MTGLLRGRAKRALAAFTAATLVTTLTAAGPQVVAATYSGSSAASWADSHATSYTCYSGSHPTALPCDTDDCTNFVSAALHYGGGYKEVVGDGFVNNGSNWFLTKNGLGAWVQSRTWAYTSGSPSQYTFQIVHSPGGSIVGTKAGTTTYVYSGLSPGDLLFFNWDSNSTYDHVGMQTTRGTDSQYQGGTQYGDLMDQHTNDRRRVWWTLYPYNAQRNTTTITLVHIASGN